MTTLHDRMVQMVRQLSMPLIEVSLVISKYTKALLSELESVADTQGEVIPPILKSAWELDEPMGQAGDHASTIPMDRIISAVDSDRMDILDTLIRTTINDEELACSDSLLLMRRWEMDVRSRLVAISSPGQLFSPMDIPEDH